MCQSAWPLNCTAAPLPVRKNVTPWPVKDPPVSVITPSLMMNRPGANVTLTEPLKFMPPQ